MHDLIKSRTRVSRGLLAFAAALVVATVLCIFFVDKPVAQFMRANQGLRLLFQACAAPSLLALPGAGIYLLYAAAQRLRGRAAGGRTWLVASVAVLAGTAAKDELKWMFGRPWPGSWIQYGDYRFHPFINSVFYGSFPSGHTTYIAAPLCVLWVLLPRYRLVWGGIIAMVMAGLVAANYHFVGDVLAGLLTGIGCAWLSLVLMKQGNA